MEQFTAAEAVKLSQEALSLDGAYGRIETERQIAMIKSAAKSGMRSTCMIGMHPQYLEIVRLRLEALGFTIKEHTGPEPEDCFTGIHW